MKNKLLSMVVSSAVLLSVGTSLCFAEDNPVNYGDIDNNGIVNVFDSIKMRRAINNTIELSDTEKISGDICNADSKRIVDSSDLSALNNFLLSGIMNYSGFIDVSGKTYYYNPNTNQPQYGLVIYDKKLYYVSEDEGMLYGLQSLSEYNGALLCFHPDEGYALRGWQTVDGNRYYFSDGYSALTGIQEIGGSLYYFENNGRLHEEQGWVRVNNKRYFVGDDAKLITGLLMTDGYMYYINDDGSQYTSYGWLDIGDYRYFVNTDATLHTGWLRYPNEYGATYYFYVDGRMLTGWQEIDGNTYWFGDSGVMATGDVNFDGVIHQFGPDGIYDGILEE